MRLNPGELKINFCQELLNFKTTEDIEPFSEGIIGQDRAVRAVQLGLQVKQEGYNIFMTGKTGTGKSTYAKAVTRERAKKMPVPPDLCYVFNFNEPANPKALKLPAGTGASLKLDMDSLIEELKEDIPKVFAGEDYENKKNEIMSGYQAKSNKLLENLEKDIREDGFVLQNTGQGTMPTPILINKEGKPLTQEEYQSLPAEERKNLKEKSIEIKQELEKLRRIIRNIRIEAQDELSSLDKEIGLTVIKPIIDNLRVKYKDCQQITDYLAAVEEDIMENVDQFKKDKEDKNPLLVIQQNNVESFFVRYQINLLVNNKNTEGAPIVVETNPTYYNLFGKIEGKSQFGAITTDFTLIKEGSFHRANGGFLIINARDLLQKPFSWETLKRALLNREIVVENIGEQYRAIPITSLRPEPISLNIKLILLGNPYLYQLLYHYDEEFKKLFKVKAAFDFEMSRNEDNIQSFVSFIATISQREKIKHFTAAAVSKVIEYSSRLTESKDKLSTCFNEILEILYEANAWAEINNHNYVEEKDVVMALEEKEKRSNLSEEKIQEMIDKDHILLDITGEQTGQINGLSVYQTGQYSFGRPTRITASTYLGQEGIINIEREAKMSGNIHNKGVMILSGYLGNQYAKDKPLSLSALLAFEQSYGGVDGDSASCAELLVLLSSISGIPLKQELAITGSMNQKGDIQPIGGVNYKIEGFYKVCKSKGLTGRQGVIIPYQNIDNLMLKTEIIQAAEDGQFSIYAIKNIEQAIELMMGKKAEEVHQKVSEILAEFAHKAAEYGIEDDDEDE